MSRHNAQDARSRDKVLVIGDDGRITLPIVRSLGRKGIVVHLASSNEHDPGIRSRFLKKRYDIGSYRRDDDTWKHRLLELCQRENYTLILPATEAAVFACHQHRHDLDSLPLQLISSRAFETVFDKRKTYELADRLGIPIPHGVFVETDENCAELIDEHPLPAIVKPCSSVNAGSTISKHFVRKVETRDGFREYASQLQDDGSGFVVQAWVEGSGVGVEVLADRGEILFAFQHQRLHETSGYGSTYRQSVPVEAELLDAASRMLAELDYTGVAMVEFRRSERTGQWVLLEINGRFWGSLPLAVAAGANFPYYLFQLAVHRCREFEQRNLAGTYCRSVVDDARWLWRNLRGKHVESGSSDNESLGWEVNRIPPHQWFAELLNLVTLREHWDSFAFDDWGPGLYEILQLVREGIQRAAAPVASRLGSILSRVGSRTWQRSPGRSAS